jgi:hypothetical protein
VSVYTFKGKKKKLKEELSQVVEVDVLLDLIQQGKLRVYRNDHLISVPPSM